MRPNGTLPRCGKPRAYSIGRRMSGLDSWAMVAPSVHSTMECTIDCGCTTTSMRSKPTSNSSLASITSRPLFMSVDESTVIFGPIDHVGCASASSMVTFARSAGVRPRNGPPLAVSTMRATSSWLPARRHWCTALCSLSTGTISPGGARLVGDRHDARPHGLGLLDQRVDRARRAERHDLVVATRGGDDIERLGPDRPRRSEDGDSRRHVALLTFVEFAGSRPANSTK